VANLKFRTKTFCLLIAAGAFLLWVALPISGRPPCDVFPAVTASFPARAEKQAEHVTVVSLNMAEATDTETVLGSLRKIDPMGGADVFLLQEVLHAESDSRTIAVSMARELGYSMVFAPGDEVEPGIMRGNAVVSRFPMSNPEIIPLQAHTLRFKNRCRVALGVTLQTSFGPMRVINLHLDSRINRGQRLRQLRPVLESASSFEGPTIIGGDFNTANVLWIGHLIPLPYLRSQEPAVRETLQSHGFSTPFENTGRTFSYLPLKLDWIFLRQLQSLDAGVEPIPFSDHRGLWVRVQPEGSVE
jgi:endonuclease/exonuclease/phosphatase (EEP) superfamily protein YafD